MTDYHGGDIGSFKLVPFGCGMQKTVTSYGKKLENFLIFAEMHFRNGLRLFVTRFYSEESVTIQITECSGRGFWL